VLFRAGIALSKKGKWRRVAGPALLTRHLRVSGALNCKSVSKRTGLWLEDRSIHIKPSEIVRGKRVGVDYAGKKWAAKPYNFRISEPRIKRIVRSFSCQGGGVIDARS
jgi:3-methyladenine DNA glycosylase Mpg